MVFLACYKLLNSFISCHLTSLVSFLSGAALPIIYHIFGILVDHHIYCGKPFLFIFNVKILILDDSKLFHNETLLQISHTQLLAAG